MAPSVRVRRSSYTPLRENSPRTSPQENFTPELEQQQSSPGFPFVSGSLPLEAIPERENGMGLRPPARFGRPRAGSKVSHHVMSQASLRGPRPPSSSGGPRSRSSSFANSRRTSSPSPHSPYGDGRVVALEGPQAEVLIHGDPQEPGRIGSALSLPGSEHESCHVDESDEDNEDHHHDDIVEHLDVIDPQVATVSTLTNAANAILIPPLSFYSRKPIVVLDTPARRPPSDPAKGKQTDPDYEDSLDRHVDDILKRPSKFKRTMRGVWSFLKTPLGIVTAIYGFFVVFWGAAIVIFLIKIINFHNKSTQGFWVEVSSQVENGLFTLVGIGLIPPRLIDTYRIVKIWHYKRRTARLRVKAGLPQLFDVDDLPDPAYDPNYVHVLSEAEQRDLHHQQVRFQKHQTWYRAHGTETHRAFPINTALLICFLNDGNSVFQIILCGCMWGLNRFERPAWTTGTLIPASFLCGIFSAVFIARGSAKSKRTAEVEARLRHALASEHPELEGVTSREMQQMSPEELRATVMDNLPNDGASASETSNRKESQEL